MQPDVTTGSRGRRGARARWVLAGAVATLLALPAGAVAEPGSEFTFAPAAPAPGQVVTFSSAECTLSTSCTWYGDDGLAGLGGEVQHTYANEGEYAVTLEVASLVDVAATSTTTRKVAVAAANVPPTAAFTVAKDGLTASFTSTSSDPDGSTPAHEWDFGDGTKGSGTAPAHTYATGGSKTVVLTVTDADGATGTATETFTVTAPPPPNGPPTSSFTVAKDGLAATFTSTATDPEGAALAHAWDFGDGTASSATNPGHTYATGGTYRVELTVDDGVNPKVTSAQDVTVVRPNRAPVAGFTATPADLKVAFDASPSTDADGNALTWSWDFGDETGSKAKAPTHAYTAPGTYDVTLTVEDGKGGVDTAAQKVTVQAPVPGNQAPTGGFTSVISGLGVAFDTDSRDLDDDPLTYGWDFGDGTGSSQKSPGHTYAAGGTYTVALAVSDGKARTVTNRTITVTAPAPPPAPPAPPAPVTPTTPVAPPASGVAGATAEGGTFTSTAPGTTAQITPPSLPTLTRAPTTGQSLLPMTPVPIIRLSGRFSGRNVRIRVLSVRAASRARVTILCTGKRCPRGTLRATIPTRRGGTGTLAVSRYAGRLLTAGTVLDIRVTQSGRVGKRVRFSFRANRSPARRDTCMRPGSTRSVACPPSA